MIRTLFSFLLLFSPIFLLPLTSSFFLPIPDLGDLKIIDNMAEERTLKEYSIPSSDEPCTIIVYPTVQGSNFKIKPALLIVVQQNQFSGSPSEDPNLHISTFWRLSVTCKDDQETVRLHLFPFSLKDKASNWFNSLKPGSITSWDQLRREFLCRFFPPSKTAQLWGKLYQFTQKERGISFRCVGTF